MTDFIAQGDCSDNVTLIQTKGSSFPVNTYVVTTPAGSQEFASGDVIHHVPHGTPTVAIHAEYRNTEGGPVLAAQDFIRPVTWLPACVVTTTTPPPATTLPPATTVPPGVTTTTTAVVTVPTTSPGTLPHTGTASDVGVGLGLTALIAGGMLLLSGVLHRTRHHD